MLVLVRDAYALPDYQAFVHYGAWMITFAFVLLVLLLGAIFFDVGDWRR